MPNPWLILETSGRAGVVGVAIADAVVSARVLDGTLRHNRDLIPACGQLLAECGFSPKQIAGVMVGLGPGSYTGLRVGLMAAKGFALASGCEFVAVPTFHTLAAQAPSQWPAVEVIADALQGMIYRQSFGSFGDAGFRSAASPLEIVPFAKWRESLAPEAGIGGPGAEQFHEALTGRLLTMTSDCHPKVETVFRLGRAIPPLTRPEWFAVEPLYLRGSSAEEKAKRLASE